MSDDAGFIRDLREQLVAAAHEHAHLGNHRARAASRFTVLVVTLVVVLAGVVIPVLWLMGLRGSDDEAARGVTSAGTSAPSSAPLAVSTFKVERGITGVAFGFDSVWVASQQQILRLDPATGDMIATIPFDADDYGKVSAGADAVWVTAGGKSVAEIDPGTNSIVATLKTEAEVAGLGTGGGFLWVSTSEQGGRLLKVEPVDASVVASVSVPPGSLQYSDGTVWVFGEDAAAQVDATTMAVQRTDFPVRAPAVVDGRSVWSISAGSAEASDAEVLQTNVGTEEVSSSTPIPRAAALAADSSGVWVLSTPGSTSSELYLPDPSQPAVATLLSSTTGQMIGGPLPVDITPARVGVGGGSLWISHYDTGTLTRVTA